MMQDDDFENYLKNVLSNSISSSNPSQNAKNKARKLSSTYFDDFKKELLIKYDGKSLEDVMDCKTCHGDFGEVLKITKKEKIDFKLKDNNFKNQIYANLKLLPKIGLKTEQNLKNKGYDTIESLKGHDRYGDAASKFLAEIEDMSYMEIVELLDANKYSKSAGTIY